MISVNRDTFFLDCKHKHMMKRGAPPDKVLHRLLHIEFYVFTGRIDFQVLSLFGSWSQFFIDGMGPLKHPIVKISL